MNCEKCYLTGGPYPIMPNNETDAFNHVDTSCESIKIVSTEDFNFYVCHKSGMPEKPIGWYPGRGY